MKEYQEFEKWLDAQSVEVKNLIQERFTALENTVKAVRNERDTFNAELKKLGEKLEKGSEAETKLLEMTSKLSSLEKKTNFFEKATSEGCIRPNVAFSLASTENLFKDDGNPDWKRIKENAPELFKVMNTKNDAGSGTHNVAPLNDANQALRDAAKR